MQDHQAIHAYAMARVAHIPADQADERDRAYMAARSEAVGGMTLRQYAAIKLRVPDSGTDWLDKMIVKAKRYEIAAMAMQAYFTDPNVGFGSDVIEAGTQSACRISAALLKARGYA